MLKSNKRYEGFSLIEILVVVALIIILATITIVAINPAKNFRDTRNAQRSADVAQILNAITQYTSEKGQSIAKWPSIMTCDTTDWKVGSPIGTDATSVDLSNGLVEEFIVAIPQDPSGGTVGNTGYVICKTAADRIQISAPSAEDGKIITVKR